MSILTSLLPGLRELRAPLAAGYVWLTALALALAVTASGATVEPTSLASDIDDAYHALGVAGRLGVFTFVAYIVGVISTSITTGLSRAERARKQPALLAWASSLLRSSSLPSDERKLLKPLTTVAYETRPRAGVKWFLMARYLDIAGDTLEVKGKEDFDKEEVLSGYELFWFSDDDVENLPEKFHILPVRATDVLTGNVMRSSLTIHVANARSAGQEVISNLTSHLISIDIDRIILRLQLEKNAAWTAIDRQRTEAEFRWGLAPPALALATVLAWRLHAGLIVYLLMVLPNAIVTIRLVWNPFPQGLSGGFFTDLATEASTRRIRLKALAQALRLTIERNPGLWIIIYAGIATWLVLATSGTDQFPLVVVTLFGAIGPPALWLVGNAADGRAIQLLIDTMTIASLKPPIIERLEVELGEDERKGKMGRVTWTVPVADGRVVLIK